MFHRTKGVYLLWSLWECISFFWTLCNKSYSFFNAFSSARSIQLFLFIQVHPVFCEFIDHVVCRFKQHFITQYTGRGDLWFMASLPSWLFLSFSESILYENKTKKSGNTWEDGVNPRMICCVVAKTIHVCCVQHVSILSV